MDCCGNGKEGWSGHWGCSGSLALHKDDYGIYILQKLAISKVKKLKGLVVQVMGKLVVPCSDSPLAVREGFCFGDADGSFGFRLGRLGFCASYPSLDRGGLESYPGFGE